MRPIKFRIYDKELNKMLYRHLEKYDNEHPHMEVMQFTGFKDYDGKEIYEGDILMDSVEVDGKIIKSNCQVYFDEMTGQWMIDLSYKNDKSCSCSLFSELQDFDYQIIGNIHENPELLNQ